MPEAHNLPDFIRETRRLTFTWHVSRMKLPPNGRLVSGHLRDYSANCRIITELGTLPYGQEPRPHRPV
jgi:hypothetical protein